MPPANVSDQAGALAAFGFHAATLSDVEYVLVDGGYRGKPFARAVQEVLGAGVEVVKRSDVPRFTVIPKQWVVERSFPWLEKCCRLWVACERHLTTSLQMVVLSFIVLLLKKFSIGA